MLVFLAALQAIPKELREASSLDGANAWQHFRFVTSGLLRNASVFAFVSAILRTAQMFDQQYIAFKDQPQPRLFGVRGNFKIFPSWFSFCGGTDCFDHCRDWFHDPVVDVARTSIPNSQLERDMD